MLIPSSEANTVVGGIDTHQDQHWAAVVDQTGRVLDTGTAGRQGRLRDGRARRRFVARDVEQGCQQALAAEHADAVAVAAVRVAHAPALVTVAIRVGQRRPADGVFFARRAKAWSRLTR